MQDNINVKSGLQWEVRIGDELVAKWFEDNSQIKSQPGVLKKIRFPFKFRFLNANVRK